MTLAKTIQTQSDGVVRALKTLGVPAGTARALVMADETDLGAAVARVLKPRALVVREGETAFDLTDAPEPYSLVIAGRGLECTSLAGLRARMTMIADVLEVGGLVGLWAATLAAQANDGTGHEALLFPFSAANGALGPSARATTPLSASSWTLMAMACGFEILACEGFGQQTLAGALAEHAGRLSMYDDRELDTGRLLMVLRKSEETR